MSIKNRTYDLNGFFILWKTINKSVLLSIILSVVILGCSGFFLSISAQNQDSVASSWHVIADHLQNASSIDVSGLETIFVVEPDNNRFLTFDLEGNRIDSVGNRGFGDYQFDQPVDIDAGNGLKIYVSDYNNRRIQIYDRRLQFLTSVKPRDNQRFFDFYKPTQVAVTNRSELYFYDQANKSIIKYNFQGELDLSFSARLEQIGLPPIDMDTLDDRLLVADTKQGVVHELSSNGQYLKFWGRFEELKAIDVTRKWIWVLTADRVHQFSLRGLPKKAIALDSITNARDIAAYKNSIYVLTENKMWKAVMGSSNGN